MTLIRIFCCFKTPIRNGFCHSFHRGGRGSYEDQLVILVYVILGGRGGGVELKMHDVILFAVFFFEGVPNPHHCLEYRMIIKIQRIYQVEHH